MGRAAVYSRSTGFVSGQRKTQSCGHIVSVQRVHDPGTQRVELQDRRGSQSREQGRDPERGLYQMVFEMSIQISMIING